MAPQRLLNQVDQSHVFWLGCWFGNWAGPEKWFQGDPGTMNKFGQVRTHRPKYCLKFNKSILSPKTLMFFLLTGVLLRFLKSVDSPGNEVFCMAFTGTLTKEGRKRKMLFEAWRFGDSKPRRMAEEEKRNLWTSSITESKINKEIILMILSGTDDCSWVGISRNSAKKMKCF